MPRQVDHDARRLQIAEALWRVVRRDGIAGASVRSVAAEAGSSGGALRHYFSTQDELLAFALRSVVQRATARARADLPHLSGRDGARRILEQLLPLDADRRDEIAVYLAFLGRPLTDPALRSVRDDVETISRDAVLMAVRMLASDGGLGPGRAPDKEVDRLYPLIDGLALHGVQWPQRYPPEHLRHILDEHLCDLRNPDPARREAAQER